MGRRERPHELLGFLRLLRFPIDSCLLVYLRFRQVSEVPDFTELLTFENAWIFGCRKLAL